VTSFEDMDRRLTEMPAVLARELHAAMQTSLLLIEADARQNAANDTGRLAGSITSQITGEGLNLIGQVGPSVRYGENVEYGRRVGAKAPPVDALMGWIRRHPRPGPHNRSQRSQAFALARSISRRGIRARPFLAPAYHKNRAAIIAAFERVGARVVAHLRGRAL